MLILGGVLVLVVLGAAGVFVVLSGKSTGGASTETTDKTTPGGGKGGGETGGGGKNKTGNGTVHGNATATHTFFMVKNEKPLDQKGTQLKDEKGSSEPLKAYNNQELLIKVEGGKKVTDYKFFYVYCIAADVVFGYVEINSTAQIPEPLKLEEGAFVSPNKKVTVTDITLVDTITMKLEGATVDASLTDYVIKAGAELPPTDGATTIALTPATLPAQQAEVMLTLPEHESWTDLKWVAFFDTKTNTTEGTITLPDGKKMLIPVHPDAKSKTRRRRAKGRRIAGMSAVKATPSKPKLLVCSYGESGVVKSMVPSDGLCDVIFYTDVTYDNDAEAIVPRDGGPAFDVLKSAAKQYRKTSFGTSMATGAIADAVKDKKSELMAAMGDIFDSKLSHFGMLNVENIEDYDKLKNADLQYIKVADEFLQGKASSLTRHRALGFSLRDGSKGPKILDAAKRVSSDFPELTIVIIKLHTENYGPSGDHWPLAPNPDDVDLSEHNALSLAAIKEDLEEPLQAIAKGGTYALLSFAMFARTYRMKQTWSGAAAREMSESSLNMDYSSVCKMKTEKDSEDTGTLYATDEHKKFLALFDSENTFTTKTNNRLNVMPQNFTGLAVYNVEMDDHKGICGKGKFVRLKAIKAALAA